MNATDTDKETPAFVLGEEMAPFWWTVKVPVPADNDYRHAALAVQYASVDQLELDKMRGLGLAEGEQPPTDEDIVRRVLRDVRLKNAAGAAVPFSPQVLDDLLRAPMLRTALVATYMAVMSGMGARKNA